MSTHELDTTGLSCPEPIMLLHKTMRKAVSGDTIVMRATDPATLRDVPNFCRHLGHHLIDAPHADADAPYCYTIQKKS